ncbi:hypothetical protein UlMin_000004 [Ulmus minor]
MSSQSYYCPVSSLLNSQQLIKSPTLSLTQLRQIHALVLKTTTLPPPPPRQLINNLHYFSYILTHLDKPLLSLSLCNSIPRSLSPLPSLSLFRHMLSHGLLPDHYTVPFVLNACSQSGLLSQGLQIHAYSVKTALITNVYVINTLMRLYSVSGLLNCVRHLFDRTPQRDLVSWTTLIQCYVKMGFPREGVAAFFRMCDEKKLKADEMTVEVVLSACSKLGQLSLGTKIHTYIRDNGVTVDVFVGNALVDMYLKCGDADIARKVFDEMPNRNVVSWNSLISGLAHQGQFKDALRMFRKMQSVGIEPDDVTLVAVLNSCANLGLLELGKWVHSYIGRYRIKADGFIGNALVAMYAKCGSIDQALMVFKRMKHRDVYSCTAIIVGLALHGEVEMALSIFSEMPKVGVKPDEVTFIGVLTACSHAGLVVEGQKYFRDMLYVYELRPQTEHYSCMVDLLGRAGLLEEAEELIRNMPMEPDAHVWGALLGACRIHGKVELGEEVMKKVVKVEPERDGAYVLMSNMYSSANKWKEALKLRKEMKEKKMRKTPGCSCIEVEGVVYEFRKGDKSHPATKEIYKLAQQMTRHMKNYEHLGCIKK